MGLFGTSSGSGKNRSSACCWCVYYSNISVLQIFIRRTVVA